MKRMIVGIRGPFIWIVVAISALVATVVLLYTTETFRSPFADRSQTVLANMFAAMSNLSSVAYDLDIHVSVEDRDEDVQSFAYDALERFANQDALRYDRRRFVDVRTVLNALESYREREGVYPVDISEVVMGTSNTDIVILHDMYAGTLGYRQEADGASFVFAVEMETDEVVQEYHAYMSEHVPSYTVPEEPARTLVFTEESDVSVLDLLAQEYDQTLSLIRMEDVYYALPLDVALHMNMSGSMSLRDRLHRGMYDIEATMRTEQRTFEGHGNIVVYDGHAYARVNTSPLLNFFDIPHVHDQWMHMSEDEILPVHIASMYSAMFQLPEARDAFRIIREHSKVQEDDRSLHHYEVAIDYALLAQAYGIEDGEDMYDVLARNSVIEVWVDDRTFHPVRMQHDIRIVPPESLRRLYGAQVRISSTFHLRDTDIRVAITPPDALSVAEVRSAVSEASEETVRIEDQVAEVGRVRMALLAHMNEHGTYPEALSELNANIPEGSYEYEGLEHEYRLRYTVTLPEEESPYHALYVDGVNTATQDTFSLEVSQ